jgi:nitrogen regulatory protein P-II 2
MKLIAAIIKPFKLDDVREALADIGVSGHHRHRGQGLRPSEGPHRTLPRRRVRRRLPAQDQGRDRRRRPLVDQVIEAITKPPHRQDRRRQDLRFDLEQVIRIRTGETGPDAL